MSEFRSWLYETYSPKTTFGKTASCGQRLPPSTLKLFEKCTVQQGGQQVDRDRPVNRWASVGRSRL